MIDALRFIERYKTQPDFQVHGAVIVIGAGNTAIDAANAAVRLGARDVHIFYRRGETEMPAFPFEYDHSKVEGVRFHWMAQPVAIVELEGRAAGVTLSANPPGRTRRQGPPCARGHPRQRVRSGLRSGDPGARAIAPHRHAAAGGQRRRIQVDRPTGRTSNPKYYAGGDCVNGGREVVDAVADGKRAALGMIEAGMVQHG